MVRCIAKTPQEANALIAKGVRFILRGQRYYERAGVRYAADVLGHHTRIIENFLRTEL